jgi:hypothetical protein
MKQAISAVKTPIKNMTNHRATSFLMTIWKEWKLQHGLFLQLSARLTCASHTCIVKPECKTWMVQMLLYNGCRPFHYMLSTPLYGDPVYMY